MRINDAMQSDENLRSGAPEQAGATARGIRSVAETVSQCFPGPANRSEGRLALTGAQGLLAPMVRDALAKAGLGATDAETEGDAVFARLFDLAVEAGEATRLGDEAGMLSAATRISALPLSQEHCEMADALVAAIAETLTAAAEGDYGDAGAKLRAAADALGEALGCAPRPAGLANAERLVNLAA